MFLTQNNIKGEYNFSTIVDLWDHWFVLRFEASPDLVCQIKKLNKTGFLGHHKVRITLYNTGKPHLMKHILLGKQFFCAKRNHRQKNSNIPNNN